MKRIPLVSPKYLYDLKIIDEKGTIENQAGEVKTLPLTVADNWSFFSFVVHPGEP